MQYKLTIYSNITNTGYNTEELLFDTFYELQDYIEEQTADMTEDERELYMNNINIKPVFSE